jgi:3-oxoadipate enol-lactonase
MPVFKRTDANIHFRTNALQDGRHTLVFANSLGSDFRIWDAVVEILDADFNLVLHDKRGHGLSDLGQSAHSIETYADDLAALIEHLKLSSVIAVGLSVGGLIVQALYHAKPELLRALVISNSAAKLGTNESWSARIDAVQSKGLASIADAIMERWFSKQYRSTRVNEMSAYRNMLVRTQTDAYVACCEALRDADYLARTSSITVPTLCIAGEEDGAAPPDVVQDTANRIAGSQFEMMAGLGHLPCIEDPNAYSKLLKDFVEKLS